MIFEPAAWQVVTFDPKGATVYAVIFGEPCRETAIAVRMTEGEAQALARSRFQECLQAAEPQHIRVVRMTAEEWLAAADAIRRANEERAP